MFKVKMNEINEQGKEKKPANEMNEINEQGKEKKPSNEMNEINEQGNEHVDHSNTIREFKNLFEIEIFLVGLLIFSIQFIFPFKL
jgi:hypothetical protein